MLHFAVFQLSNNKQVHIFKMGAFITQTLAYRKQGTCDASYTTG